MKALLLSEYGRLDVVDVPLPRPGRAEVLVRVEACGICGSDVHGFDGTSGRRIPPIIMGHEAAGTVAAIGPGASGPREGDRVTFDSTIYCGYCEFCRRGEMNLCENRQVLGVSTPEYRRSGAFAEYVVVPEHILHQLPEGIAFAEAAMIEPLAVAVHAVAISAVPENGSALVIGAGMIGLLVLQSLRDSGCLRVYVADIDDSRLQLAKQLGAAHTINPKTTDTVSEIMRLTSSKGVDVALEAVGSTPTIKAAVESVRKGGTVTLIGNIAPSAEIPLQTVVSREIRLQGSAASSGEYPQCIDMLKRGAVDLKPLISVVAPLEEGPVWFERLHAREPNLMKVVLTPGHGVDAGIPCADLNVQLQG
ncbi:MAG: galactitol-1-phosphate 5-dehydrogenase [Acidobacteriaceae bacterium]|nr:galactitol-1-phosphate 5-dehydrogenase [Acidobacteriaceae bacterium]